MQKKQSNVLDKPVGHKSSTVTAPVGVGNGGGGGNAVSADIDIKKLTVCTPLMRFSLTRFSLTGFSLTMFSLMLFFTYFFQIVFNRNHMWIRCKILISVQGECQRRGWNHCCGRGD